MRIDQGFGLAGVLILGGLVFVSSLGIIYIKHQSRQLCTQLQALQQNIESLQVEWGQLLIEQGTWAQDARIEKVARDQMQMGLPEPETVVVVEAKNEIRK